MGRCNIIEGLLNTPRRVLHLRGLPAGQIVSLDCALGPSDYPYSRLRDKFSAYYHSQVLEPPPDPMELHPPPDNPNTEEEALDHSVPGEAGNNWHGSATDPGVNLLVRGELLVRGSSGTDNAATAPIAPPPPGDDPPSSTRATASQDLPPARPPPPPPSPPPPLPDDYED